MEGNQVIQFLSDFGYLIMLPLMIIEGPAITMIAALMASMGIFNVYIVLILSIVGDIIGDILFYGAGYVWGMKFVRHVGKYLGITEAHVLKMEKYFQNHGGKTIMAFKSTTGLCWATFTAAGIVRMNFWKFVFYSVAGGIIWSGMLVALGYFYGYLWREIADTIKWIGWAVAIMAIVTFVSLNVYKKRKSQEVFEIDDKRV
jgi:membrane protein DedA with SNARE-associated domain